MHSWIKNHALQDANGHLMSYANGLIQLGAVPTLAKLMVQCELSHSGTVADTVINGIMPKTSKVSAGLDNPVFWRAPNEWLFVSDDREALTWRGEMSTFLESQSPVITDLSDSLTVIELRGENSCSLLAQGCGIDLYSSQFSAGHYASTLLFQLSVLIHRVSENPVFHIYVDRSEALHLWHILQRQAL